VCISWGTGESFGLAYGGFGRLQARLAAAIGIDRTRMEGHGGTRSWDGLTDPLVPFLRQGCDGGKLSPQECVQVRKRIWEVTMNWPPQDRESFRNFASAMAAAPFLGAHMTWG
jgi:hypothetical protein